MPPSDTPPAERRPTRDPRPATPSPAAGPQASPRSAPATAAKPAAPPATQPPASPSGGASSAEPVSGAPRPAITRPPQFRWAFPPEPPYRPRITPLRHAPAVGSDGRLYLHLHGRLVALAQEHQRASLAWEYLTNSHAPGPVVLGSDGVLRLHTADGRLHLVTTEGKQVVAPLAVGEPLGWAVPLGDPAGNTYLSAYEGGLIRVAPRGQSIDTRYFRCRQRLDCPGVVRDDTLYLGAEDGHVYAVDLQAPRAVNRWNHAAGQGVTGWFINTALALAGDTLVAAAGDEHLYGFDREGNRLWQVRLPGQITAAPVVDPQGHLYVGVTQAPRGHNSRGLLVSLDANAHQIRWEYPAAAIESTAVVGDDRTLYVGDNAGTIHAVSDQGLSQWTARVEAPVRSAGTIVAPGRVAFGLDNETLVVPECSSQGLAPGGWPKALGGPGHDGSGHGGRV